MDREQAWLALMENEPELCIRMLTVRYIMEQRDIHGPEVARYLGCSRQRVHHALNPRYVRHPDQPRVPGDATVQATINLLDRIEEAITDITRQHEWTVPSNAEEAWAEAQWSRREDRFYAEDE